MSFQEQLQCLKPVAVLVSDQRSCSFQFYQDHGILKPLQPIISSQNQANNSPRPSLLHSISKCLRVTWVITGLWAIISSIKSSISVERTGQYHTQYNLDLLINNINQFSSVAQLCPTLRSHERQHTRPPCPYQLLEFTLTHGLELVMPSNRLILCRSLLLPPLIFPASESFQMSQFFASGGQSTGVSALASVLPMNTQD